MIGDCVTPILGESLVIFAALAAADEGVRVASWTAWLCEITGASSTDLDHRSMDWARRTCSGESRQAAQNSQGSRSATPLPLSTSNGTEAWSCTICQAPSSFRKQNVTRTQMPLVAVPFISVPW